MASGRNGNGRWNLAAGQSVRNTFQKGRFGQRSSKPRCAATAATIVASRDITPSPSNLGSSSTINNQTTLTHRAGLLGNAPRDDFNRHGEDRTPGDSVDDRDDTVAAEDVYMALEMKAGGTIGCAYFVAATSTLYLYEDIRIASLEVVESILFQAQPTCILVPSSSPEKLMEFLSNLSCWISDGDQNPVGENGFVLRPVVSSDFNPDYGRQALAMSERTDIGQNQSAYFTTAVEELEDYVILGNSRPQQGSAASKQNKTMLLGTLVNLEGQASLRCAGALFRDFDKRSSTASSEPTLFKIHSIQTITSDKCMFISADTLLSLQIFRPDLRKCTGASRTDSVSCVSQSGRSVFDLFYSLALTSQGRRRLREIFTRPSMDFKVIDERQQTISDLIDTDSQNLVHKLRVALKKIKHIQPILIQLRKGLFFPGKISLMKQGAWANLKNFCCSVLQLVDLRSESCHQSCSVVKKALRDINHEAIFQVTEILTETIDFQASMESGRGVVARGVSPELDALKSAYGHLQRRLESVCQEHRSRLTDEAQGDIVGCVFHPQRGYLLVAAAILQERTNYGSKNYSSDLEFSVDAHEDALLEDGLVYFKTSGLRAVDGEFGDLAGNIIDLEVELFHELGLKVVEQEDALLEASRAVGEIDSILAMANGAKSLKLCRPQMTAENILHIHKGRHLLQELGLGSFVANDCVLAGGTGHDNEGAFAAFADTPSTASSIPSVAVLTGPNHSGKSVYLKQVAIILFLAHIGSFVPAEKATVGITDKILTRIATRESVSRGESAFGVDLRQVAFSINFATRRSLVLVDEFGKGTATADGAALFNALLDHFLRLGPSDTPKVLAATHFHEIFERQGFEQHPRLGLFHMSITLNPAASRPEDKVEFLHAIRQGRSTESFGCHCAAISGVPPAVVERATQISELLCKGANLGRICLQARGDDINVLQENEERARLFLAAMAEALDSGSTWKEPRRLLRDILDCQKV